MRRLWPDPAELDEDAVIEAYTPDPGRPLRANFVASLDGAATFRGKSEGLSNDTDRHLFKLQRMHADAVMVGAGTLRQENYRAVRLDEPRRAWRLSHGLPEYPVLVVVSARLDLDPGQGAFADAPVRPIVVTRADAPAERRAALEPVADVVDCGESVVDLQAAMAELTGRGLRAVLTEGGPHLLGALLEANLVDELCLTVSPLLVGPGPKRIAEGAGMAEPVGMTLVHLLEEENTLFTRYARE